MLEFVDAPDLPCMPGVAASAYIYAHTVCHSRCACRALAARACRCAAGVHRPGGGSGRGAPLRDAERRAERKKRLLFCRQICMPNDGGQDGEP